MIQIPIYLSVDSRNGKVLSITRAPYQTRRHILFDAANLPAEGGIGTWWYREGAVIYENPRPIITTTEVS